MPYTINMEIGLSGAFVTRRWEDPESYIRLTKETGFPIHEFCADSIDPLYMGTKKFRKTLAQRIKSACIENKVSINCLYTGMATHRFHGLSHSSPECRRKMKQWIVEIMELALEMGTDRIGGRWDTFPVEVMDDPEKKKAAVSRIIQTFRDLSRIAKDKGIAAIYNEQMYVPSEYPYLLDEAEEFLIEVNKNNTQGCPVYLTVDVGHQAGQEYGISYPDTSYVEWLKRYAAVSETIHVQQTRPEGSYHWGFTEEYNKLGHIRMEEILDAIRYSHEHYFENPVSKYLNPIKFHTLALEVIPSSTKSEDNLIKEIAESAKYLRKYIPEGGLNINI